MPLSKDPLPVELLELILPQLETRELGRCMSASRTFYLISAPVLYRSLRVDFARAVNPLFIRGVPITPRWTRSVSLFSGHSIGGTETDNCSPAQKLLNRFSHRSSASVGSLRSSYSPLPHPYSHLVVPYLPDRFSFTTHLTITSHSHSICDKLSPLIMPFLETLRIVPAAKEAHLDVCHCNHSLSGKLCPPSARCGCPLVAHLLPRRLVLGGKATDLTGSARGLWPSPSAFPPPHIKELLIYVGLRARRGSVRLDRPSFLSVLPSSVERLELVDMAFQEGLQPDVFWTRLGMACIGEAQGTNLMGLE